MTDRNTLSKGTYIFEHIFWSLLTMLWFNNFLFRSIEGLTYARSRLALWVALALSILTGIVLTWRRRRNNLSLFVNIMLPFGLYTLIAYGRAAPLLIYVLATAAVALSAVYAVLVLMRRIRAGARTSVVIRRRLGRVLLGARTISVCCLAAMVLTLGFGSVFGTAFFSPSVSAESRSEHEEMTIAANIETVSRLDEEVWSGLSVQEKLDTLQTVANIEAYYLGLPHELNVILGKLPETTAANYNDRTHVITLNIEYFEDEEAHELLDSVCHEARHAYQYRLCEVYDDVGDGLKALRIFDDVREYKQEFTDYVDGGEDISGYYMQRCEQDARSYAYDAVYDYYSKIDAYREDTEV